MKYVLFIHHGDSATPNEQEAWERLPEAERQQITRDYQAINQMARAAHDRALEPVHDDAERRFLESRRAGLTE